ncbi:MAG TPA: hypothetical protein PKZ84_12765 [Anaerolineae bacterium]|nr:hypothetical protein [Anaerolineae bacterium]HQI85698.1 hypothetical protein [Anaerolineae bacterium]
MDALSRIWQQAQTGDRVGARRELVNILRGQPDNAQAWLLMAALLEDPAQQADCCRKVLALDPANRHAAAMLQKLRQPTSSAAPPTTAAASISCPHCGAALDFSAAAAQRELRTVCAYCNTELIYTDRGVQIVPPAVTPAVEVPELFEYTQAGETDEEQLAALSRDDLVRYVVRELGGEADRNTLIRYVCEAGNMPWPQAETFVARVALEHEHEIARRRSPFMLVLSVGTLVGGIVLALMSGYATLAFFSAQPVVRLDYAIYGLLSGLGMTAGGLIGVVRLVKSLRDASV